ncbi:MAG TPA: hypothetical protein VIG97_11330 [Luteimonas sp.]
MIRIRLSGWLLFWIVIGLYEAVAAIGGSTPGAFGALVCGFCAGIAATTPPKRT